IAPWPSKLLVLASRGLLDMGHPDHASVGGGIEGRVDRYVLDMAARELDLPSKKAEVQVVDRRIGRKSDLPDKIAMLFVGERELDDVLQPSHERVIHVLAKICRQDRNAVVFFHLLEQVPDLNIRVTVV